MPKSSAAPPPQLPAILCHHVSQVLFIDGERVTEVDISEPRHAVLTGVDEISKEQNLVDRLDMLYDIRSTFHETNS
ncbi:jg21148 [Pararge aegeria aegeria]|uniref:Jg21148 protein n=1 Tax=Pararge aegeria aegeria TaxID=348720 RepID=A0A8S4SMK1_9NEOP|nr:jg21148 [Pararge aegeria aegeria]